MQHQPVGRWFSRTEWTLATLPCTRSPIIPPSNLDSRGSEGHASSAKKGKPKKQVVLVVKPPPFAHHHRPTRADDRNSTSLAPILRLLAPLVTWPPIPGGCANIERARQRTVPTDDTPTVGFWGAWVWWACLTARPCDSPLSQPWHPTKYSSFVLFLEHALEFSASHSGGHPAAKGSASDKRLGARGQTSAIVWSRLKRGGHENAAPAALQVGLGLQWSPNGRISRSPWRAGLVSAANINNGNNIREPSAVSADWTGLATFGGRSCKLSGRPAPSQLVAGTGCFKNLTHLCVCVWMRCQTGLILI